MYYKKFSELPKEIQEKYNAEVNRFNPMEKFERIVLCGKQVGASDIHIIPVDYDFDNQDVLVKIKYRIDGDLDNYIYNLGEKYSSDSRSYIKMKDYANFTYAVKDNLGLTANDGFIPGDARHTFEHKDEQGNILNKTKLRINVMPTGIEIVDLTTNDKKIFKGYHQSIVSRIIVDDIKDLPTFDALEILPSIKKRLLDFLKAGNGSLLISGETGSGKSVLLQILASLVANESSKIHTLEDPIEYINPLIVQTQINIDKGFGWIEGLTALMRQDPDKIVVGEIRNKEVAKMAFEASITGHMLFSTIHAKSGIGTYDRLRQMGIPSHILSSLTISIGARLSKRLCPYCKQSVEDNLEKENLGKVFDNFYGGFDFSKMSGEDLCFMIKDTKEEFKAQLDNLILQLKSCNKGILETEGKGENPAQFKNKKNDINKTIYNAMKDFFVNNSYKRKKGGCEKCFNKGTKGRIGIHEFIFMNKELEKLILDERPTKFMEDYVRKTENVITLERNGIIKMMRGDIDYNELIRLNVNND